MFVVVVLAEYTVTVTFSLCAKVKDTVGPAAFKRSSHRGACLGVGCCNVQKPALKLCCVFMLTLSNVTAMLVERITLANEPIGHSQQTYALLLMRISLEH